MGVSEIIVAQIEARWPELVAAIGVAIVFSGFGSWRSARAARSRLRRRIGDELLQTQRIIRKRAGADGDWKQNGTRDKWMLEPFERRVDFLRELAQAEALGSHVVQAIDQYQIALSAFIELWGEAKRRGDAFRRSYDLTVAKLEQAVGALGRRRKLQGSLDEVRRAAAAPSDDGGVRSFDALNARSADA